MLGCQVCEIRVRVRVLLWIVIWKLSYYLPNAIIPKAGILHYHHLFNKTAFGTHQTNLKTFLFFLFHIRSTSVVDSNDILSEHCPFLNYYTTYNNDKIRTLHNTGLISLGCYNKNNYFAIKAGGMLITGV